MTSPHTHFSGPDPLWVSSWRSVAAIIELFSAGVWSSLFTSSLLFLEMVRLQRKSKSAEVMWEPWLLVWGIWGHGEVGQGR